MPFQVIDRYILFQCVKAWLGVSLVLLVLTLGVGFADFIAEAAAGNLPVSLVFTIAGFSLVQNLSIILPVSLLLAIMITIGRLCSDHEMAALSAGGVGLLRLYRPIMFLAFVLAVFSAWISLFVAPGAVRSIKTIQSVSSAALMQIVEAGQFTEIKDGNVVFYAGSINKNTGRMQNIFVRIRQRQNDKVQGAVVITAKTAIQNRNSDAGFRTLVLLDGRRYEGVPGQADYRVTKFAEYGLRLRASQATTQVDDIAATSTTTLLGRDSAAAIAELQSRISTPLSLLILALLAVPLGYLSPRSGRYGKLILGIVIYVAYANALRLGEVWVVQSVVPKYVGLWWVHGAVLALALVLIGRWQGWWRRGVKTT